MANNNLHPTPMASRLLTIPREIRDLIYSHLGNSISVEWTWPTEHLRTKNIFSPRLLPQAVRLQVQNAPQLSVLLTHSRLHDEYLEIVSRNGLSATVDLGRGGDWWSSHKASTELLDRLRHVNISLSVPFLSSPSLDNGPIMEDLADIINGKAPQLASLQVVLQSQYIYYESRDDFKDLFLPVIIKSTPPPIFGDLPLLNHAAGYRFNSQICPSRHSLLNNFERVCCYTYARNCNVQEAWIPGDILDRFNPDWSPHSKNLATITTETLGKGMDEWWEKRGYEEVKAWF
ncbi:hypothetical protein N0V83_009711 [Neocucurbitaria cava]|uniref:Uncharacterized protein n=1 Tax=Neocucurbitaria cava TaxID=798079 RepID=A0A9W9CHZ9_9PLEO|nr:hypothetical protein N0V83_009711 [Neocucurbitaria cava]